MSLLKPVEFIDVRFKRLLMQFLIWIISVLRVKCFAKNCPTMDLRSTLKLLSGCYRFYLAMANINLLAIVGL